MSEGPNEIVYMSHAELPVYTDTDSFTKAGEIISQLFNSKGWKDHFDAITHLRVLLKTAPHYIDTIFTTFGMQILESTQTVKTKILKNAFLFLNEVFQSSSSTNSIPDPVIEQFVPILLQKSIDEQKIIQIPAQECLMSFISTCALRDVAYITVIKSGVLAKSQAIQEISLKMLDSLMSKANQNLMNLQGQTFTYIMKGLTHTIAIPRLSIKTLSKSIIEHMAQLVGNTAYLNMINNVLTPEELKTIQDNYEEHLQKQNKSKQKDFSSLRKSFSQFKVHQKHVLDPSLKQQGVIQIKTSQGEHYEGVLPQAQQFQGILQEQSLNMPYQDQQQQQFQQQYYSQNQQQQQQPFCATSNGYQGNGFFQQQQQQTFVNNDCGNRNNISNNGFNQGGSMMVQNNFDNNMNNNSNQQGMQQQQQQYQFNQDRQINSNNQYYS